MSAARGACIALVSCLVLVSAPAVGQATTRSGDPAAGAPGVPTHVRAIAGDNSVTVTWSPPPTGQASVVSYTVTSSTGQTTTADVPNDYEIVEGLTNGDSYSFSVHADTASGTTGPSASSNSVTPAPIPRPRDVLRGRPQSVTYDQYSLMIGGKRTFIYAAEFDPWRLPSPSLWLDRLEKIKADGYNAVTPYFDWDYSSPAPGVHDFSGVRDMNKFLNLAQEAGLYVIARPGPYINAETDGGGFPGWLVTQSGTARTDASDFVAASDQWLSEIDPIIAAHQITRGGDVILYQVENELFHSDTSTDDYMAELEAKARADGINVPLTDNSSDTFEGTNGSPQIAGYDSYPLGFNCADTSAFGTPPTFSAEPGMPLMLPEFQGGSYDAWGGSGYANCYALTGPSFENVFYKSNLADGVTIQSNYMGVGGTNWGWLPAPFMYTSYDYGAAIQETGEIGTPSDPNTIPGSKYGENKLIGDFVQAAPSLTKTVPVAAPALDNPSVAATARVNPDDLTQFIYLRQADASSTATVSAHMALNTDQTGIYTYDDTSASLVYTGNWSHVSDQSYTGGDYDNTESFSDTAGDSMSVTFTGTAVQWIAPTSGNHGIADVSLDGKPVATVDGYSPGTNFQQVEYSVSGLADSSHTLTIEVSGQKNPASSGTYVSIDAINVPTAAQATDYYPVVPQTGSLMLQGRDAKLLLAHDSFDGQQLVYSTSELMTQAQIGNRAVALLYGPARTDGETVLRYTSQPTVKVLTGKVTSMWDSTRGDLRLDYVHTGLAEVQISGGGRSPLLLLLAQKSVAEQFWPESTSAGPALVRGSYLVRTARARGSTLALTGDTSQAGTLSVWAPSGIDSITWNGRPVATTTRRGGSLAGSVGGAAPVTLPALAGWRFAFETPEAQPGYDDSNWVLADHSVTTNPTTPVTTPVLYADDYGFHTGFVWYRGHFTATGSETGINLTVGGGTHGAFSVWLNGAFLGSDTAGGDSMQMSFPFPAAALRAGQDNVVAVLTQSSGHDEDGVYGPAPSDAQKAPRGLLGASLEGASTPVTWRLQGGDSAQDPVRGPLNVTGLYGTNHGWDLPGYPDRSWQSVSLPDWWSTRGLPPGIGWYRTSFALDLPRQSYVPVAVQIDGPGPGAGTTTANYRAFIFVNGWLMGQYDNKLGPQHQFYVPAGILNQDGNNALAIAVWGLDQSAGLDQVKLVALGDQSGGVPVQNVNSPGYNPAAYGPPTAPSPTLGVVSSAALVNPGQPFTVKATLNNPGSAPLRDAAVNLNAPAGWKVAPAGPASLGTVAPGSSASASFQVTPASSGSSSPGPVDLVAQSTYDVSGQSRTLLGTAQLQVPFSSLAASFDNTGITDDSDTNPSSGFEGFDGEGTTFSAQGLASAGLTPGAAVSAGGLSFTWPNVPSAQPDNTMAEGQIIRVSGSGSELGFLASANNSPESGTGTVYYTDGTTSTYTLDVGNFWYASGQSGNPVNDQVAAVNYANYPTGSSGHTVYVFEQSVPIDSGKTVEAVALPPLGSAAGYNPALHVFAVGVGS
ncbi:MAG: beta-galactosidase [Solirubrobacteraceae bacterium]